MTFHAVEFGAFHDARDPAHSWNINADHLRFIHFRRVPKRKAKSLCSICSIFFADSKSLTEVVFFVT